MASHRPPNYNEVRLHNYVRHWNRTPDLTVVDHDAVAWATEEERQERQKKYGQVARDYYDLTSPILEQGWFSSFHFAPMVPGLSIEESMIAYEQLYAKMARLKKGMRVLDLGCGVGGPARVIAAETGANIVGLTNSDWHVERGTAMTKKAGLDHLITFVKGDYMKLPFPDESFDAAYSIEALCYAPDPILAYREIQRVLKPGAPFTLHDFAMTEKFDESIPEHRKVRNWIEFGNGMTKLAWVPSMREALKGAGFEVIREEDVQLRSAPMPWYFAPAGNIWWAWRTPGWTDFWKVFKMWMPFRNVVQNIYRLRYYVGLEPKESSSLFDMMWYCPKGCATGAAMGIFTPMYLFICEKPAKKKA
ncbi:S-adenosyl-L-methionine-dependent methyltransferase [Parathielavia hyrcaniae]|uniref:Sterol 24-C-methyltransferase n=1 Tax=Parathielavia hyrcaniae TaxID=113614 RepID=A0AAN6QBW3_9PEZI|nr:S-adenosyl-L-methionine-dependent methyltransferase [Parathielavia hyrcaniae]